MALMSLRSFAKSNGITVTTVQNLINEGVLTKDPSGMIDSKESIRIYRKKLNSKIRHYTLFLTFKGDGTFEDNLRSFMSGEDAVEVSCFDEICIKFNEALQEKAAGMSVLVNKKYKEKILAEFIKRYKECLKNQLFSAVSDETVNKLSLSAVFGLLAYGTFPEGYEHLIDENVASYAKVCTERRLLEYNNAMEEKFSKICDDLALYWNDTNEKVFERNSIDKDFFIDIRRSSLHKEIVDNAKEFATGDDAGNCTEVFRDLKASCKTSFQSGVLTEFEKKHFYRIITIGSSMSREESLKLVNEIRASDCNEVIVCNTKEATSKYVPEGLMMYLDSLQMDRMDNVVYAEDLLKNCTAKPADKKASYAEPVAAKPVEAVQKVSEMQENEEADMKSGVESIVAEPVETVQEVKEIVQETSEKIDSGNETDVTDLSAGDAIRDLLGSVV